MNNPDFYLVLFLERLNEIERQNQRLRRQKPPRQRFSLRSLLFFL